MDHKRNPLRHIQDLQVRHLVLQILAWMWCIAFSLYFGSFVVFGYTVVAHFILIIAIVVNMYLIQQDEIADFKIKNLFKYLGFGLSIFPFIIIFYLIFPRAEFNFRVFDTPMSTLGIPDTINLGSFSEFSNSEEEVFILINNNYNKDELYFRVKVFVIH